MIIETPRLCWWERDILCVSPFELCCCADSAPPHRSTRWMCLPQQCFSQMGKWEASPWDPFIYITSQSAFPAGTLLFGSVSAAPSLGDRIWIACVMLSIWQFPLAPSFPNTMEGKGWELYCNTGIFHRSFACTVLCPETRVMSGSGWEELEGLPAAPPPLLHGLGVFRPCCSAAVTPALGLFMLFHLELQYFYLLL